MTPDELAWWRKWLPLTTEEEIAAMPRTVRALVADLIAELDQLRRERDAEERRAWDGYAAGCLASYEQESDSHGAGWAADPKECADRAARLLSERRKRFPRPEGKK